MLEVNKYRRYADTCRKLSLDVGDLEMATAWTLLADDREEQLVLHTDGEPNR